MFRKCKKGAEVPSSPATIFGIITLLVVMYVILIPPSFREELLNGNGTTWDENGVSSDYKVTFFSEEPGYWSYLSYKNFEHDLNSFNLLSRTEASELFIANQISSKYTAFSKNTGSFKFTVSNIGTLDNFFINYKISSQNGPVSLIVNGNTVKEITPNTREDVVSINKKYINVGENEIEFVPKNVGFEFWSYNSIVVSQAKVFADVTDYSNLENSQSFWVSEDEFKNLEDGYLRFFVDCEVASAGKVDISINDNKVFSGIPDCGILNVINHISPNFFNQGENEISFKAKDGRFIFDTLMLETNLKDNIYPTYFFDVSDDDYYVINNFDDEVDLNMTFTFINNQDYKELQAVLNGHTISVNTRDRTYIIEVNPIDILEGTNVLELRPKDSMTIVKVELKAAESN
ncbi:hypothetical protein JXM83_06630 [Candidatus Woesearchaeota archaeon]|nr:hypothetical protein [Candidatus Woesearchaeota archaeon]